MSPRIVVLMGCYNEEQYLEQTIPAVLNQNMPDFRLFLLDNGSTDKSWSILQGFAHYDPRITLLRSPRNLRCPDAMNLGTHAAMQFWPECQWFVTAGADDIMDPDYLDAILASAAANPGVNCIFSPMRYIDHPDKGTWTYPAFDPKHVHEVLYVPGWRAFTRELWDANGPEYTELPGVGAGADWEWICRASVLGHLKPYQLSRSHVSLRVRPPERTTQSELGHWSSLHARMCELMYTPIPRWAQNERIGPRAERRPNHRVSHR